MSQVASVSSASSAVYHMDQRVVLSQLTLEQKMKLFPAKQQAELESAEVVIYECGRDRYEVEFRCERSREIRFWSRAHHSQEVDCIEQFQKVKAVDAKGVEEARKRQGYCRWSQFLTLDQKKKLFPDLSESQLTDAEVVICIERHLVGTGYGLSVMKIGEQEFTRRCHPLDSGNLGSIINSCQNECEEMRKKSDALMLKIERSKSGYCPWSESLTLDQKVKLFPKWQRSELYDTQVVVWRTTYDYEALILGMWIQERGWSWSCGDPSERDKINVLNQCRTEYEKRTLYY